MFWCKNVCDFKAAKNTEKCCEKIYLDHRVNSEIVNIKTQIEQIVSDLGLPISSGGSHDDYLCCMASGLIQFVCIRESRENYRSITTDRIQIHPGSNMFRQDPLYIVAGEIVRTSRMFAMSVSPLTKNILNRLPGNIYFQLHGGSKNNKKDKFDKALLNKGVLQNNDKFEGRKERQSNFIPNKNLDNDNTICFGQEVCEIRKVKGKKTIILNWL